MLGEVLSALSPRDGGIYVDGTFGAGGYARAVLEAADCRVIAIDRDPEAIAGGAPLAEVLDGRLRLVHGRFSEMESLLAELGLTSVDGIFLDVGVSSMQIDDAGRGFSFSRDGPLDMRMSRTGISAEDIVNALPVDELSRIIAVLGEERRARAIALSIVKARSKQRISSTLALVSAIETATGRQKPHDKIHPATRTFQALRIAVNGELEELALGLAAAERLLRPAGRLVVVTFHSLEDRIVKRFLAERASQRPSGSRHLPEARHPEPSFKLLFKGPAEVSETEAARNPRARSAKLRAAVRTEAPAHPLDPASVGVPRAGIAGARC
jgi:16S rRNA (cytosine1402-N4)-methyltransferase